MQTIHKVLFSDARNIIALEADSIDLVVTSPPYPMIEMWDELFCQLNPEIGTALASDSGQDAFELMNLELDKIWHELYRVLKPGGIICINIGDATRKIGGNFALYSNHSRIARTLTKLSLTALPLILWRKSTNAPNKFMGSGMLPAGAYVTLEHEYILIFRKGRKRPFVSQPEKQNRRASAIFWEERNKWFSDLWNLKGVKQALNGGQLRKRSAAFPFELPFRLVNMYSVKGDTVLDPFLGTGTTTFAAIASGRHSYGIEYDHKFSNMILADLSKIRETANIRIKRRLTEHMEFLGERQALNKTLKYKNSPYGFPVMTAQETDLELAFVHTLQALDDTSICAEYIPAGNVIKSDKIENGLESI